MHSSCHHQPEILCYAQERMLFQDCVMNNPDRDYYDELGVPKDTDEKAIKAAYHRLAMKWHPDRNKSPEAEERFKRIAKAYAILSDSRKRAKYDARGFEGVAHYSADELFGGLDLGSIFGDLGFGFGPGGDSVFDRFFHRARPQMRGRDIRISVEIPLEVIQAGGSWEVRFSHPKACPRCHGQGTADGRAPPICPDCGGSGHRAIRSEREQGAQTIQIQRILTCERCRGQGTLAGEPCPVCNGVGLVSDPRTLRVHIPRGIEDGMSLRIPGHGDPGPSPEVLPGDLFVSIHAKPDSRFQRRGADLWRSEMLYPDEAALGSKLIVPTLDGDVEVTIPPGSQPDEVLRLRGKGLPRYDREGHGDLNIRLEVQIPTSLSARERELYRQLQAERDR
jgi:molecular chaperone DnaJ